MVHRLPRVGVNAKIFLFLRIFIQANRGATLRGMELYVSYISQEKPCDQEIISCIKRRYKKWYNQCLLKDEEVSKYDKIVKLAEISNNLEEKIIHHGWSKVRCKT